MMRFIDFNLYLTNTKLVVHDLSLDEYTKHLHEFFVNKKIDDKNLYDVLIFLFASVHFIQPKVQIIQFEINKPPEPNEPLNPFNYDNIQINTIESYLKKLYELINKF